jgi:hypothetical protein
MGTAAKSAGSGAVAEFLVTQGYSTRQNDVEILVKPVISLDKAKYRGS